MPKIPANTITAEQTSTCNVISKSLFALNDSYVFYSFNRTFLMVPSTRYLNLMTVILLTTRPDSNRTQTDNGICSINTATSEGIIQSPNYPNDYRPYRNIVYTIQAPPNRTIALTFNTFILENMFDFIYVS